MTKEREASDADTTAPATEQEAGRGGDGAGKMATTTGVVAECTTMGTRMAGTVDAAGTLLAGVERSAPTARVAATA